MTLKIEADLENRLKTVAAKLGLDMEGYVKTALLRQLLADESQMDRQAAFEGQPLDQALQGLTGVIHSGGKERLSEDTGARFTEYLLEKQREGHV